MGKKMTDITLEILNLDKQEFITIDIISNQEFTEVTLVVFSIKYFILMIIFNKLLWHVI